MHEELFQIGLSCLQKNDFPNIWSKNMFENTIYTQSFLLLLDSILGFGPENLNGTWAQQKEKQCATERMWDGTFGFFDTEYLNGKGAQQGKQWAIESMWRGVRGFLRQKI